MPVTQRRAAGTLAAIVLLCGAAVGTRALSGARRAARHEEMVEAADGARSRAQDAVQAQLSAVEGRAVAAASNPVLRAQLGVVDAATLRDRMSSEPWWEPARRDFNISGIAVNDKPAVLLGSDPALDFTALLKTARMRHQASAVVSGTDAAVIAGAAVVDKPGEAGTFAVLLARPLDTAFIDEIASRTRASAMLTDGRRVLVASGPPADQDFLGAAVGKERDGLFEGTARVSASSPLVPGLWLWTLAPGPTVARTSDATGAMIWGFAGLLAALSLFLAFRPEPKPAPSKPPPTTGAPTSGAATPE